MLEKHNSSNNHKQSFENYKLRLFVKNSRFFSNKIKNKRRHLKNREIVILLLRCVLFLRRQNIGLRGHIETDNTSQLSK